MTPVGTVSPNALWRQSQEAEQRSPSLARAANDQAKRIPALDGLRMMAALYVVIFHYWPWLLPGGFVGVDIFFVLSGYLITGILLREFEANGKIEFRKFFYRRACRLVPALCLMVVLTTLAVGLGGLDPKGHVWRDAGWALVYLSNWQRVYLTQFGDSHFFGHTWSLSVEEQFYLTWPFLLAWTACRATRRQLLAVTVGLIAAVMLWRWTLVFWGVGPYRLYHGFDTRADELLTGCALAMAMSIDECREAAIGALRRLPWLPFVLLAALPVFASRNGMCTAQMEVTGYPIIASSTAAVIVACHHLPQQSFGRFLSLPPLVYLGSISYGIYLWHVPIANVFVYGSGFHASQHLFAVVLTVVAAVVSYHGFERRFMTHRGAPLPRSAPQNA